MTLLQQGWREQYRAAEKYAKDNRLRIWQNYIAQSALHDNDNNTASATSGKSNDPTSKEYQVKINHLFLSYLIHIYSGENIRSC